MEKDKYIESIREQYKTTRKILKTVFVIDAVIATMAIHSLVTLASTPFLKGLCSLTLILIIWNFYQATQRYKEAIRDEKWLLKINGVYEYKK